jgi:hypothetical protein
MQANVKTFVKATGHLPELSLGGDLEQGGEGSHTPMDQSSDDGPGEIEAEDPDDDDEDDGDAGEIFDGFSEANAERGEGQEGANRVDEEANNIEDDDGY